MNCEPPGEQSWLQRLHASLLLRDKPDYSVLDLYCGGGGFSLGFAASGFRVRGIDENSDAVATYSGNVGEADCTHLDCDTELPKADVLIAGPPCQPWSRAGKQLGELDVREGFSVVDRAVEAVHPKAVVVENVPDISRERGRSRLRQFLTGLQKRGYRVRERILNSADFGVPQNRRRTFVLAIRSTEPVKLPEPWDRRFTVQDAISDTSHLAPEGSRFLSPEMDRYVARYERASGCRLPRDLHLDKPARTLTVRNLFGATGDMMRLRLPDGRRRMLTVTEAARLQSFPDWYHFHGSLQSRFSQIGNAVPPLLGLAVAQQVRRGLASLEQA